MNMRRIISSLVIGSMALVGGVAAGNSASAATTPTLVMTGGNAVYNLDPIQPPVNPKHC